MMTVNIGWHTHVMVRLALRTHFYIITWKSWSITNKLSGLDIYSIITHSYTMEIIIAILSELTTLTFIRITWPPKYTSQYLYKSGLWISTKITQKSFGNHVNLNPWQTFMVVPCNNFQNNLFTYQLFCTIRRYSMVVSFS